MHTRPDRGFLITILLLASATTLMFGLRYLGLIQSGGAEAYEDFHFFYQAAQNLHQLGASHVYSVEVSRHYLETLGASGVEHPFVYPPVLLLWLWPLGLLSYQTAALCWFGMQVGLYALALRLVFNSVLFPTLDRSVGFYTLSMAALASPAILVTFLFGQIGILTAALTIAGLALIEKHPNWAGACFGMLIIKPSLAVFIPLALLAGGKWRVIISAGVTVVVLMLITILLWGAPLWLQCMEVMSLHAQIVTVGAPRLMQMMVSLYTALRQWGFSYERAMALQGVVSLLSIAALVHGWRSTHDRGLRTALVCAAMLAGLPYLFAYDLPLLILPLGWLANNCIGKGLTGGERKLLALAAFVPLIAVQSNGLHMPIAWFSSIGLLAVLYRRAAKT